MTRILDSGRLTLASRSLFGGQTCELGEEARTSVDFFQILPLIQPILQKMMPHDLAAIALQDEKAGDLFLRELSSKYELGSAQVAMPSTEVTPAGWALTHEKPLFVSTIHLEQFSKPFQGLPYGMSFGCWVPLSQRGEVMGVLFVGSRRDAQLEKRALDLVASSPHAGAIEITDNLQQTINSKEKTRREISCREDQPRSEWKFENVIGMSNGFRNVMEQVRRVAPGGEVVLIHGENGTEKEVIARMIHELSPRNRGYLPGCIALDNHLTFWQGSCLATKRIA